MWPSACMFNLRLRPDQSAFNARIEASWAAGNQNVLGVFPTGGGKTIVKAHRAALNFSQGKKYLAVAHRDVLLSQISLSMAKMGVYHTFIASRSTIRFATDLHVAELGQSYFRESAPICVASVGSLTHKKKRTAAEFICARVDEWNIDEAHHITQGSMWALVAEMCYNARGLGVTATPCRSDGKGLGRHYDGVFDDLVVGASMTDLIEAGNLTPFRIFAPQHADVNAELRTVKTTKSGDWNKDGSAHAVDKPHITGSAVDHYKRIAPGERAITFGVTIAHCQRVADQFNAAGIPSKMLSAKHSDRERHDTLKEFKGGQILNLVNCDLFGEGFDLPAVVVGIMLRPTQSYGLYMQQFGRTLRPFPEASKTHGIIIDHVGNYRRHGRPDKPPIWSLDGTYTGGGAGEAWEDRICPECAEVYAPEYKTRPVCPYCGHAETLSERATATKDLQEKDGYLVEQELDDFADVRTRLAELAVPIGTIRSRTNFAAGGAASNRSVNDRVRLLQTLAILTKQVQRWCEIVQLQTGWSAEIVQREFSLVFGVHPVRAQVLPERKALELTDRLRSDKFKIERLHL